MFYAYYFFSDLDKVDEIQVYNRFNIKSFGFYAKNEGKVVRFEFLPIFNLAVGEYRIVGVIFLIFGQCIIKNVLLYRFSNDMVFVPRSY